MRVRVGLSVLVVVACGRSGFDENPGDATSSPDFTTDPLDWADFGRISNAVEITGTNQPIDLELRVSYGTGTPIVQFRINGTEFYGITPTAPATATVSPGETLQFRVVGNFGETAFLTIVNTSSFDALVDTTVGTVSSLVTGGGTPTDPYFSPDPLPESCGDYLAGYSEQQGRNGTYRAAPGGIARDVYCDMTTDGGGWTLVARVLGASTVHSTTGALDTLTDPAQPTTAKLADALINTMAFTHSRMVIAGVGTVYVKLPTVSFGTTSLAQQQNKVAVALAGPYTYSLYTTISCNADCGVSVCNQNIGFGAYCGYRYWASSGTPRSGMGCKGNFAKDGTVWVR